MENNVIEAMADAKKKALDALARYKFWMFGYHAARWVNYNKLFIQAERQANPFLSLVHTAREVQGTPGGCPKQGAGPWGEAPNPVLIRAAWETLNAAIGVQEQTKTGSLAAIRDLQDVGVYLGCVR